MELIAAVLIAGPLGYFAPSAARGRLYYLLLWVIVFPIQTIVVFNESGDDNDLWYWVVNAAILCAGLAANAFGSRLRSRRLAAG